jgi:lipopolysaccharide/colanic/teichoic acid biosynthesis glycosyltransferase
LEDQLSAKSVVPETLKVVNLDTSFQFPDIYGSDAYDAQAPAQKSPMDARFSLHLVQEQVSLWSQSRGKRIFDCISVLLVLPFLTPIFLLVALGIRFSSRGPVLFLQKRMGRYGRPFTILKFRTLTHLEGAAHHAVTTAGNQRFTPVGPFLRRWKLDELPQLLNVLWGDMSLVGARPKLPEHQIIALTYRPGITGAATIAFAREELALAGVPKEQLDFYYRTVILPAKHEMDAAYMARATFRSDLKLIVDSVLRRWDRSIVDDLLNAKTWEAEPAMRRTSAPALTIASAHLPVMTSDEPLV